MADIITTECGHTISRHNDWPARITHSTVDCPECGRLLILVSESEARDFHKHLHEQDPAWPADGEGTGYVEFTP